MGVRSSMSHVVNRFFGRDPTKYMPYGYGGYSYRPDRLRLKKGNEKSVINAICTRIAMDVAAVEMFHVRLDEEGRYAEDVNSNLNQCLILEANTDQTAREFRQDIAMSMMDEGFVAVVPIDAEYNDTGELTDVYSMRTGKVMEWKPSSLIINVYNEQAMIRENIEVPKKECAVIENPLYSVMNEPNSMMQRLSKKLAMLDSIDEQVSSGKLDLIIQLPYAVRSDSRKKQAEERRTSLQDQLKDSTYGVAYTDATERIIQLNRPLENNLLKQIEYITTLVFAQVGMTPGILDGTADEKTMLNYNVHIVEPFAAAIVDNLKRRFLTKEARTDRETILFFRDPFKLVPLSELSDVVDTLSRNEILSSNEFRHILGRKPSKNPKADELLNKNMKGGDQAVTPQDTSTQDYLQNMNDFDDFDDELDLLEKEMDSLTHAEDFLRHYASEYYDPVKAKEYYERTKQLKGRKSTSGLNDKGKAAARYVKDTLKTEKETKVTGESEKRDSNIESEKKKLYSKIDALRNLLKGMDSEQRASVKDQIYSQIDGLREENKSLRTEIRSKFKTTKTEITEEYDEKYMDELENIKNTASMRKK